MLSFAVAAILDGVDGYIARLVKRGFRVAICEQVEDPRKAWIELDYCVAVAREDTSEAKRVFKEVKERTPTSSPVWPRIQQLEKTYQ